ncbi:DUF5994 family protein [Streptomyces olivochromogenes]|uniref:Uncharacterized protein n=1 Tax=Streptomyces olivochromogenes TaxID=1963 RepID=A0A250VPZ4_STROL|nr:DUF5994 family protein [Streptomyces olivochromogenes]KUN39714.1 hypothetical protein AQJ27_42155 [Streptomyces olivochromogenes]GAX56156.1 hypothetical protein SO3561_07723 [Streptomyces olivochromogenes]
MAAPFEATLPRREPVAAPPARLALKTDGTPQGLLDGAWWPRSRDLLRELPSLMDVLDPLWGRITRIAVNPEHWLFVPHRVPVDGHVVKVGWFTPEIDPHQLLLLSYGTGRWDLLVIPPETATASAVRLMTAASDGDGSPLTASALVAADRAHHDVSAAERPLGPDEAWEYEGGTSPDSPAVPERPSRLVIGM